MYPTLERHYVGELDIDALLRFSLSAAAADSPFFRRGGVDSWLGGHSLCNPLDVERIAFDEMRGWSFDDRTGNLRHDSGRFFSVEGLDVRTDWEVGGRWSQPIINQPEIGILGILVKEFGGVLHFLMQAKSEPGNIGGVQLSPTVQATRSNYIGVHNGRAVPYIEFFRSRESSTPLVDVLQSEQGAWFLRKRNRNMIVEVVGPVSAHPDFYWMTLGQIRRLLRQDNIVNMDARTVLSCIPWLLDESGTREVDRFTIALGQGLSPDGRSLHSTSHILHWLTEIKARHELVQTNVGLSDVGGWFRTDREITHESGKYFDVVAVDVAASSREVGSWTQPLLKPAGRGVAVFVAKPIDGVLHVLVHAKMEAGVLDVAELAPTLQCLPGNYLDLPQNHQPLFLTEFLEGRLGKVHYSGVQSEEGGRFLDADNVYEVIEVGDEFPVDVPPEYCWMTPAQVISLLLHSNYFNVQARSLMACLQSIW